jgi:hypothetical protein
LPAGPSPPPACAAQHGVTHHDFYYSELPTIDMRLTIYVALLCICLNSFASAASLTLDGTWDVAFSTRDGETRMAIVEIAASTGTWMSLPQSGKEKNDPCVGRPFPLKVTSPASSNVVIAVSFASSISSCKDRTVTGKLLDSNVIEGKLENGKPLRMVRRVAK